MSLYVGLVALLLAPAVFASLAVIGVVVAAVALVLAVSLVRGQPSRPSGQGPARTMVVLGSGGHTAEMLMLLDNLDKQLYSPRTYIVAETDAMSGSKANSREELWHKSSTPSTFSVVRIPRSREVGQSYFTSVGTTLYSLWAASYLVWRQRPEVVLVNGPGTCIPICAAATLFRLLGLRPCRIVYVESIARTRRFSLSAKLLYHTRMADMLLVQWEALQHAYPRAVYAGRLY